MNLKNKTILITGGTGSFGNAFVNYSIRNNLFKKIIIFSRDEMKQWFMKEKYKRYNQKLRFFIGDVRDYRRLEKSLIDVDYVIHAAATKIVPTAEYDPFECVKTNVIGAMNVIDACINRNVVKVLALSTDKACNPINLYGSTKLASDKLFISANNNFKNTTTFSVVRYGNVMGSRGSVIPLFVNQMLNGKEVTITDPEMTRFLMTLDDSVDLVLHAFENGKQGDIFVKKSPAANLNDLVKTLFNIFKIEKKSKIIGTRHGEKLFETLISREEMAKAEDLGQYYRIPADNRDLNYSKYFTEGEKSISEFNDYTSHNADQLDINELSSLLSKLPFIKEKLGD